MEKRAQKKQVYLVFFAKTFILLVQHSHLLSISLPQTIIKWKCCFKIGQDILLSPQRRANYICVILSFTFHFGTLEKLGVPECYTG